MGLGGAIKSIIPSGYSGWTVFKPSVSVANGGTNVFDTNIIYCSDSLGSDSRDGSTPTAVDDNNTVQFIVTSASATVGAIYSNNSQSFTVAATITNKTFLKMTGRTGSPAASGVLTRTGGAAGDPTITFSDFTLGIHGPVQTLIKAVGGSGPGPSTLTNGGDGSGLGTKGAGSSFAFRTGKPDWILLKESDIFIGQSFETGLADNFGKGGFSASEPMLISTYDPSQPGVAHPGIAPRPLILVPNNKNAFQLQGGSGGNYLALVGLNVYAYTRDPANPSYVGPGSLNNTSGIFFINHFDWFLCEGCWFKFFGTNITTNVQLSILTNSTGHNTMVSSEWTQGSGWSIAATVATASVASSDLSQVVNLVTGVPYRIGYIITITAGSLTASVGGAPGITRTVSGAYMEDIVCGAGGTGALVAFAGVGFSGTILTAQIYSVRGQILILRRSVISDAIMPGQINNGMSMYGVTGSALIEECLYNNNGSQDARCRNLYIGFDSQNVTFRYNISANSGSEGVQFRTGGTVYANIFARNSNGFDIGHDEGTTLNTYSEVYNNVVLESEDRTFGPRGNGIVYMNSAGSSVHVHDNIIAHWGGVLTTNASIVQTDAFAPIGGVDIAPGSTGRMTNATSTGTDGTHGIIDTNNIWYDWPKGLSDLGGVNDGHGAANTFTNFQDLAGANIAGYPRPGTNTRDGTNSIGSYHGSIYQTPTTDAFLLRMEEQCKHNWNTEYTTLAVLNYIRAGFGLAPVG